MGLDGQQLHPSMRASRETQHGPGFKETINTVTCPSLATLKGDKRNTSVKRVMFMDVHWLGLQKNLPSMRAIKPSMDPESKRPSFFIFFS